MKKPTEELRRLFAANLKRLRKAKDLTQAALADELKTHFNLDLQRTAIAAYEQGESLPSVESLYAIAAIFRTPMDALFQAADSHTGEETITAEFANRLIQRYVKALTISEFYFGFTRSFLQKLLQQAADKKQEEHIKNLFDQTFFDCLLKRDDFLRQLVSPVLSEAEQKMIQALQNGGSIAQIASAWQTSEADIVGQIEEIAQKITPQVERL